MMRAAQDPALNWGEATSLSRLFSLVNRADFTAQSSGAESEGWSPSLPVAAARARLSRAADAETTSPPGAGSLSRSEAFDGIASGLPDLLPRARVDGPDPGGWGLFVSLSSRRGPPSWVLLTVFRHQPGRRHVRRRGRRPTKAFDTLLVHEGFLLGCYFVLAVWIALGATDLAQAAAEAGSPHDRRRWRSSRSAWGAAVVLGLAVLVPSLIAHDDVVHAQRRAVRGSLRGAASSRSCPIGLGRGHLRRRANPAPGLSPGRARRARGRRGGRRGRALRRLVSRAARRAASVARFRLAPTPSRMT